MCKDWLLKTNRLLIRPLKEVNFKAFHDYHSLEKVYCYQSFQPSNYKASLDYIKKHTSQDSCILEVIDLSEETLLGDISLTFIKDQQVEIGYSFDPNFQKQGYAYEACQKVLDHLFISQGMHRVYATLVPENIASERLLKKLNFRKEGHFKKSVWTGQVWLDDMVYGILGDEYKVDNEVKMLNKKQVLNYAKEQLAKDYNCQVKDLDQTTNTLSENLLLNGRRIYEGEGALLKILCFGSCAVFTASKTIHPFLQENYLNRYSSWLFDFENLRAIDKHLSDLGHEIDELSVFYLPNPDEKVIEPPFTFKWFEKDDIEAFRGDKRFQEAFIFDPDCPDVLGIGAYDDDGQIMGMAGATSDTDKLYQIGIDVIDGYRHMGIGASLVRLLKNELLSRGIVPFYKTSVSHMTSRNVAINAGFFPGWTEVYTRKIKD